MVQLSFMDGHLTDPLPNVTVRQQNVVDKSWRRLGNGYCIWEVLRDDGIIRIDSQGEPKQTILEMKILGQRNWLNLTDRTIHVDFEGVSEPEVRIYFENPRHCAAAWRFRSQILLRAKQFGKRAELPSRSIQISRGDPSAGSEYNQEVFCICRKVQDGTLMIACEGGWED